MKLRSIESYGHSGLKAEVTIFEEFLLAELIEELKNCDVLPSTPGHHMIHKSTLDRVINFVSKLTTMKPESTDIFDEPKEFFEEK